MTLRSVFVVLFVLLAVGASTFDLEHLSQRTVEIEWVSGCGRDSVPRRTTSNCALSGGTRITVRGRAFRAPVTVTLIDSRNRRDITLCENVEHSPQLPSLILFCTLPVGELAQTRHLRVISETGSAILRDAIKFEANEKMHKLLNDAVDWNDHMLLGVGGVQEQFREIFRRVFMARMPNVVSLTESLGLRSVRGVILHGPSGTGKTLMARKIADLLDAKHVQLISGPEIISKYVGESEKNLRNLFIKAEAKDPSELHVIIIDEIDSILKPRGAGDDSGSRAVYDGVTTQMLAFLDGLTPRSNVLVMGMTNRLDSLDKALLRPGRFEVQIRIPLPDSKARLQIFEIHTKKLREMRYLADDVSLTDMAAATSSLSGADIEGIVNSAVTRAMDRAYFQKEAEKFEVTLSDMKSGLKEVLSSKYSLANTNRYLERGVVAYSVYMHDMVTRLDSLAEQMKSSSCLRLSRHVIFGKPGVGTTTIAAMACHRSQFSFVSVLSAESFVGLNTEEKRKRIASAFDSASAVSEACIVIDKVENLIEYSSVQGRLNTVLLQELSMYLSRPPVSHGQGKDAKILALLTSSNTEALKLLSEGGFDGTTELYALSRSEAATMLDEYRVFESREDAVAASSRLPVQIGVKRLMYLIDAASARTPGVSRRLPAHNLVDAGSMPLESESDQLVQQHISLSIWTETLIDHGMLSDEVDEGPTFFSSTFQM